MGWSWGRMLKSVGSGWRIPMNIEFFQTDEVTWGWKGKSWLCYQYYKKKKSRQFLSVLCQGNFGLANHDKERRKVIESGGAVVTEYHTLRNNREENKRRLLRVPWTARRSNMPILKEINPEYSLEGLMLKLKLQLTLATWCKEPTLWKIPWWWEKLKARREWQTMVGWHQWLNGHEFEQTPGDGEGQGGLVSCSP